MFSAKVLNKFAGRRFLLPMHEGLPRLHPILNVIWKQIQGLYLQPPLHVICRQRLLSSTLRKKKRVTLFLAEGPLPLTAATRAPHSGPFGKDRGQPNVTPHLPWPRARCLVSRRPLH